MHYPDLILKAEGIIINATPHLSSHTVECMRMWLGSNVLFGQFLLRKNNFHFQICIWFYFVETMSEKSDICWFAYMSDV